MINKFGKDLRVNIDQLNFLTNPVKSDYLSQLSISNVSLHQEKLYNSSLFSPTEIPKY